MILKEIKTTDLDPNKKYTFVLPMGATEQHGPFLPLGTDTYCQEAILEVAKNECKDVIFLPTLEITCSDEHEGHIGTVWITSKTMHLVLFDIVTSLQDYAKDVIFTSWHGGNLEPIDKFIQKEQKNFSHINFHHISPDTQSVLEKTKEILNGPVDEHAGNSEISMMLAVDSNLVQVPPIDYPKKQSNIDWSIPKAVKKASLDGILDDHPNWVVSKEHGKVFIELSAKHLSNEIKRITDIV